MAGLRLDRVSKIWPGGTRAVDALSLEVADGEFVALLGPSGCGKSTTLRMIAGLEEVSSGSIHFGDRDVTHMAPKNRDIGMVFQNYALYPHLSVEENIGFPLAIAKVGAEERRRRVEEVCSLLGLAELMRRRPKELSGGQRQRVALGRAIVRRPSLFLFDEPLSNLDARLRVAMRAELGALHKRLKTTSVYVTHDQTEAMTLGDRVVIMNKGVVEQQGPPAEVYANPDTLFVASFLGSPPINIFSAEVVRRDGIALREDGREGLFLHLGAPALRSSGALDGIKKVTVGIRPESLRLIDPSDAESGVATFAAKASVVEFLGHETIVWFTTGGTQKSIRVSPETAVHPGDTIAVAAESAKVMLFDDAGRRL